MAAIRVRVGAQLEPGAVAIFQPLIAAAKQARAKIGTEGSGMGSDFVGGYRTAPAHAKAAGDAIVAATRQTAARVSAEEKRAAREREKDAEHVFQIKQRYLQQEEAAAAKALAKRQKTAVDIGGSAMSTFGGYLSRGVGLAGSIARGAGVDFDVGSLTHKVSTAQKTATEISNSAYMEGQSGAAGQRQDPAKLIAEARAVADSAAMDTNDALLGLQKFVAKTSDLATGRAILGDMANLAKVTGASLEDMVDAAGDVSKNLGDIPDNAEKTKQIMTVVAQQGKLGSVEIKDLASQMAKVAAGAGKFDGGMDNAIIALGAMAQTSRGTGGSASAAQAATSVASFVTDLTSKAGQKALAGGGVNVWADKGRTTMKPVQQIIKDILAATHGDLARVSALVPGKQSGRAFGGFAKIYNEAEKKQKGSGLDAVDAEFKRLTATLSKTEISESLARVTATTESKVQRFNNQLERIAEEAAGRVLPALEKLAPTAIDAAGGLGKLVGWAAENPWQAVGAMAAAAIGKEIASAGIKSVFESGLKSLFGGAGGKALTVVATAVAIEQVGEVIIDKVMKAREAAADEEANKPFVESEQKRIAKEVASGRPLDATDRAALVKEEESLRTRVNEALQAPTTTGGKLLYGIGALATEGNAGLNNATQTLKDAKDIGALEARLAEVTAQLQRNNALMSGTLKVTVTNQPGSPVGPGAKGTRTGPDAH